MATGELLSRLAPYGEQLATNPYLFETLHDAVESLRRAYGRAEKRKAAVARDDRFYRQLRNAADAFAEFQDALVSGRTEPRRRERRVVLLGLAVAGAGVVAYVKTRERQGGDVHPTG